MWRLGLDIGTNSIGWSVIELGENGKPCRLENAGVRIFSEGRKAESKATLKATRREARSGRRRRDRFKQRQRFLLDELQKAGLFPPTKAEQLKLQTLNPIELRANALREKLNPHEIGRALFHLNQRRGFKSNRKDQSKSVTSGKISNSARNLLEQMGLIDKAMSSEEYEALSKEQKKVARDKEVRARKKALADLTKNKTLSYGRFLWENLHKRGLPTRARYNSDTKIYDVYPTRELLEDEFQKIWHTQKRYYPTLLTEKLLRRIHAVIFTQRPLKLQTVGKCSYLSSEDRTFRAMPSFQRYRIYQEVNNLTWSTSKLTYKLIDYPETRNEIVGMLERVSTQRGHVTFGKMKTLLKRKGLAEGDFQFNLETRKRSGLEGNLTSNLMQHEDCIGPQWHEWPLEKQDQLIWTMVGETVEEKGVKRLLTDKEVEDRLVRNFSIPELAAQNCVSAHISDGIANLSLKAARLLLEKMSDGYLIQPHAASAVSEEVEGFANSFSKCGKVLAHLPYYGQAFQESGHIIPGSNDPCDSGDDLKYYGGVANPTVHIALNQMRHVVNDLIDRYGHPASIAIELARELPAGEEKRKKIEKENKQNQDENLQLDNKLQEHGYAQNSDNRLRLRLWKELDEDPNGRLCPFSGKKIGIADLFSDDGSVEIEHLIPFSMSLDSSRNNKVICMQKANRAKGKQIPFEAFSHSPEGYKWDEIFERSKKLPKQKQWRFTENAWEIWKRDYKDFTSRHLNDTRYIGRLTKEYLENICPSEKIDVLTGRLTFLLCKQWGLYTVLRDEHSSQDSVRNKNRNDHRHHAVDAIVIGMTSRSMLQKVSTAAKRAEELWLDRLFPTAQHGNSPLNPWDGFRDDVVRTIRGIIVSHKPNLKKLIPGKTDGKLHKATAYGIIKALDQNENRLSKVVVRWPIEKFENEKHLGSIRDPHLKKNFLATFRKAHHNKTDQKGTDAIKVLARKKGIRRLRRVENLSVIPIRDQSNEIYKAHPGDSNWGLEIFSYPEGHEKAGKWVGETISRFLANQKEFKPGSTYRPHPAARLVMRLQIDDCIEIENPDRENMHKCFLRVQKLSANKVTLAPLNEANVDARDRDSEDSFKFIVKSPNKLKSLNAKKVHISPTGLVNYEKRWSRILKG